MLQLLLKRGGLRRIQLAQNVGSHALVSPRLVRGIGIHGGHSNKESD